MEEMIRNPLKGMLYDSKGEKRPYAEVEAFVLSRRKQEDELMKKLKAEETQAVKDEKQAKVNQVKQVFDEKIAKMTADRMAASKTAEAEAKKAEAEAKKAVAEAKKNTKLRAEAEAGA